MSQHHPRQIPVTPITRRKFHEIKLGPFTLWKHGKHGALELYFRLSAHSRWAIAIYTSAQLVRRSPIPTEFDRPTPDHGDLR